MEGVIRDDAGALPAGVLKGILAAVDDTARDEFIEGLDKRLFILDREPGRHAEMALLHYIAEWAVSVHLQVSPRWRFNGAETDRKLEAKELGEPVDSEGLRALVKR